MRALIIVDVQNDFLPGGALAVPSGDEVIPVINRISPEFPCVVASQDWHPDNHGSFAANHRGREPGQRILLNGLDQVLWPAHCVEGSAGAEFASNLDTSRVERVFRKGTDVDVDSYSAFADNGQRRDTGLEQYLRDRGVTSVYVAGLATDYCVKFTALDAARRGFETYLVQDASRGVELQAGDVERSVAEMREQGIHVVASREMSPAPGDRFI